MYWTKANSRKIDENSLEYLPSVKAYLLANGVEIIDVKETKTIPYPTKAPQYTRFFSKLFLEPEEPVTQEKMLEKKYAEIAIDALKKKQPNDDYKNYIEAFKITCSNEGQRAADKVREARKKKNTLYEEKKEFWGKFKTGLDVIGFRIGGSLGVYEVMGDTLGDVEVDLAGVKIKLSDVKWLGFAASLGLFTYISNKWIQYKVKKIDEDLSFELERVYKRSIWETLEEFEKYFPRAVRRFEPKVENDIKNNGVAYRVKYLSKCAQ